MTTATGERQANIFAIVVLIVLALVITFLIIATIFFYNVYARGIANQTQATFLFATAIVLAAILVGICIYAIVKIVRHRSIVVSDGKKSSISISAPNDILVDNGPVAISTAPSFPPPSMFPTPVQPESSVYVTQKPAPASGSVYIRQPTDQPTDQSIVPVRQTAQPIVPPRQLPAQPTAPVQPTAQPIVPTQPTAPVRSLPIPAQVPQQQQVQQQQQVFQQQLPQQVIEQQVQKPIIQQPIIQPPIFQQSPQQPLQPEKSSLYVTQEPIQPIIQPVIQPVIQQPENSSLYVTQESARPMVQQQPLQPEKSSLYVTQAPLMFPQIQPLSLGQPIYTRMPPIAPPSPQGPEYLPSRTPLVNNTPPSYSPSAGNWGIGDNK